MSQERIIVLEDEAVVAWDISQKLEGFGYQVVSRVNSGDSAMEGAWKLKPDLLLLDINVKGTMDGIEVANKIKKDLGIPFIFLTAYADEVTMERAKQTGPFSYILKPFTDQELNIAIKMTLKWNKMLKNLEESERRYRDLFENTADLIMIINDLGKIEYFNRECTKILGYSGDELGSMDIMDILDPSCQDHCRETFKKVISGESVRTEAKFRTRDGKTITIEGNCSRMGLLENHAGVRCIFRDITDAKNHQQLREALYQILSQTEQSVTLDDLYSHIQGIVIGLVGVKNCYIALYDREKDNLNFSYFKDEYDKAPNSRSLSSGITDYVIKSKKPLLFNSDLCRELVSSGDIEMVGKPPKDWMGVPLFISDRYTGVLAVQDYDRENLFGERELNVMGVLSGQVAFALHRKQAEEDLRKSEELYRLLVEKINDAFFKVNLEGIILYMSPAIEKFTKYKTQQLVGKQVMDFVNNEDLAQLKAAMDKISGGENVSLEFRIIDLDGVNKYVRSSGSLVRGENGEPPAIVGMVTDITEQRKMTIQLQQGQKMEVIGQLAGGVAHDFNNLLAGIIGSAELLQVKLAGQPELTAVVDNIIAIGTNAASLTRQLLSFARKGNYQKNAINIHDVINDVVEIVRKTIDRRIDIKCRLDADYNTVIGDYAQLENALLNLCINAKDAMPQGGTLSLSTGLTEIDERYTRNHLYKIKQGKYVCISVADTGQGMSKETLTHIFEPFFTTKEPGKGTGLGLASVYGCIKSHNGSVEVYSETGHGSVFNLYLPVAPGFVSAKVKKINFKIIPGNERVLLVDDEEIIRDISSQMLSDNGYQVTVMANGVDAIEYYRNNFREVDVVILDMIMPKMNGYEVFIKLKEINPEIKAMLSSGYSLEDDSNRMAAMGVRGFLQKPYHLAELTQKIREVLGENINEKTAKRPGEFVNEE